MNNRQKYDKVFLESFSVNEITLESLEYNSITGWDSVGHMQLIAALEAEFGIMIEMEDIVDFSSYKKGLEIIAKNGVEL